MKLKEEYVLTNDNQFHVWRISTISNWRRRESSTPTIQKKEPLKISDAEALMDDLLFPHKSSLTIRVNIFLFYVDCVWIFFLNGIVLILVKKYSALFKANKDTCYVITKWNHKYASVKEK